MGDFDLPGTSGGVAPVKVKLTIRADEVFAQQFGNGYDNATREVIIRNFGEAKIRQMAETGEPIPSEISITAGPGSGRVFPVTDIDAQLMLKSWA